LFLVNVNTMDHIFYEYIYPKFFSCKPKFSVSGLVHIMSKFLQSDLSSGFYLYLRFYNSDLGNSSPIENLTSNSITFKKGNILNLPLTRSIFCHKLANNIVLIFDLVCLTHKQSFSYISSLLSNILCIQNKLFPRNDHS
jgi:hypothetical protein